MQFRVIVVTDPQTHTPTNCTAASAHCNYVYGYSYTATYWYGIRHANGSRPVCLLRNDNPGQSAVAHTLEPIVPITQRLLAYWPKYSDILHDA